MLVALQRAIGYRRLVGLGAALIALLLLAVSATATNLGRRQEALARRSDSSNLLERATAARVEANNLFSWQIVSVMALTRNDQAALDPDRDARRHYRSTLAALARHLDDLGPISRVPAESALISSAKRDVELLGVLDQQIEDDYASGDPDRRERALQLASGPQIDQFQQTAGALAELADLVQARAARDVEESGVLGGQVELLLVGLTAAMITALSGLALWVWRGDRRNTETITRLELEAHHDPLTGLANRRAWDQALDLALHRAELTGTPLTVVLIDLDHFKLFNDSYGHPAGDRHLCAIADVLDTGVRRNDVVARIGGEEFGLLLPGTTTEEAVRVVDRMRPAVPGGQTFSAGVAQWDGHESTTDLICRADFALYDAKAAGRNRFALAG